jgi:hypothetical protein
MVYAQVYQADRRDHCNILLGEIEMKIGVRVNTEPDRMKKIKGLTQQVYFKPVIGDYTTGSVKLNRSALQLGNLLASIKDEQSVARAIITSEDLAEKLQSLGLPEDSALSVLVVKVFGNITNLHDHMNHYKNTNVNGVSEQMAERLKEKRAEVNLMSDIRTLSKGSGHFRILRTSPLTKVPFVCCPTCE